MEEPDTVDGQKKYDYSLKIPICAFLCFSYLFVLLLSCFTIVPADQSVPSYICSASTPKEKGRW